MSETIILKGEFKFPSGAMKLALLGVSLFGLAPVIGTFIYFLIDGSGNSLMTYASFLLITPFTGGLSYGWYRLMRKQYRMRFANIYSDRLDSGTTYGRKVYRRIEASKIEGVDVHESIFGKSTYGYVEVRGSGLGSVRLDPIVNPEKFAEAVRSIASAARGKATEHVAEGLGKSVENL